LEACEVAFLRILEGDPYDTEAHFYLGNIRLAQEKAAEAKEQFELSLYGGYLYQQFPECVNNLGVSCARLGELDRARELFEQAAQQQEFYSDSLWNMQYLQEGVGVERLKWTRRKVF
jgi:TolA-binding protein